MKVLHVGQMIGGLDIYIRNSIVYNKADNEYVIVCGDKDKHEPVIRDGKVVREYHISLYRRLNPFNDLRALIQTIKIIRKEKPDIIHCHSAKGGVIGRTAGWITGTPTCYTPHAFSFLCTPSKLKRNIYLAIEKLTKFKTFVMACSESEQQLAKEKVGYDEKHDLVWHNAVPDASLEKGKLVNIDEPYACYIGRPSYQKNVLSLLDVIKEVKDKGCTLKFILLGVGYHSPELAEVRQEIKDFHLEDTITLMPWVSHADCMEYVRKSAFYVTTALYEGLPLAVIEAMSVGEAIIASDAVGNKDGVEDGINGYLLPLKVDEFVDKIIELASNNDLLEKMDKQSRELFLTKFFIENRIKLLQTNYNTMILKNSLGGADLKLLLALPSTLHYEERRVA